MKPAASPRPSRVALVLCAAAASLFACAAAAGCSDSTGAPAGATSNDGGGDADGVGSTGADASADAPSDAATRADGADGADGSTVVKKIVFVSTATSNGTMTFGGLFVTAGRASADKLCNQEARGIGLPGTFIAWLSTFTENAPERLPDNAAWYLPNSLSVVFPSRVAIPAGPGVPIDREAGGSFAGSAGAWTGTEHSGVRAQNNCSDWSVGTAASAARRGRTDAVGFWTAERDDTCDQQLRIYCFEK